MVYSLDSKGPAGRGKFTRATGLLPVEDDVEYTESRARFYSDLGEVERRRKSARIRESKGEISRLLREYGIND